MSRSSRTPRSVERYALPIIAIVLVVGAAAATMALTITSTPARAGVPPSAPASVPHFVDLNAPGAPRIVVIGAANETLPGTSNEAGLLMANLRTGRIPAGATSATVLSDANCDPDADGISHCLNDLDIGGTVVTVQHHHAMSTVPCLSPGETVTLMTLEQYRRQS